MAAPEQAVSGAASAELQPSRGSGAPRRGGRRGGGQQQHDDASTSQGHRSRGGRRGGGGGRGGNNRPRGAGAASQRPEKENVKAVSSASDPLAAQAISGQIGSNDASNNNAEAGDGEDVEAEVCFICASVVVHQSVAPCNHRTCHICALRLRALYKTRACAHCRAESPFVIFTDDSSKRYEDFVDGDFKNVDDALGIKYETLDIHDDTILLLRYNCPEETCDIACYGWPDLHRHVRSVHHKVMCDLCTRNKKVFTHEHELFTQQELRKHEKFGDDNPGAIDQSGFKGHPECGFCRRRFYGDDELFVHCREKHERCHICDRRNGGRAQQYFADYNALEAHFRKDHFQCMEKDCLEKKFVVFESEMDLKAHQLETHPNSMSKDVRREARMVNMSNFDYRTPHQEDRRTGRGRGRGRDPNAPTDIPPSSMPQTRGEIAFQRHLAIQSAQSVTTRNFGGELTSSAQNATAPRQPAAATAPRADAGSLAAPMSELNVRARSSSPGKTGATTNDQPLNPREEARRLQHQGVMDRAAAMLRNDPSKLESFRSRVSSYKTSKITASELIDTFFSLFDVASAELGKLIKELADIYEAESKRADLLKAWNDWKAINEDYPSLPGPSGTAQAPSTGSGGRRILRLKSSTAQSSRSAAGRSAGWAGLPSAGSNLSSASWMNPFPALPAAASSSARPKGATPWANSVTAGAGGSGGASRSVGASPARKPTAAAMTSAPRASSDAFPELPKAAKPNVHIFGLHRGTVQWNDGRSSVPKANPWEAASGSGSGAGAKVPKSAEASAHASDAEPDLHDAAGKVQGGGKKKGKKGKEVLYKFG